MAEVAVVLAACDQEYQQALRANIVAHQQSFMQGNGRAWQGYRTHQTVLPADGVKKQPDVGTKKPSDETVNWPVSIRNLATLQAIQVHKYLAPDDNHGYLIIRQTMIGGELWQASEDVGGFVGSTPWAKVEPLEVVPGG